MSKPTEVIVLCEDYRQSAFTLSYLKRCGINRGIRPLLSPHGRGSAEQWVRSQYPIQVEAYRLAKSRKHTWLIVVVDADMATVARRLGQMNAALKQAGDHRLHEIDAENEKIARLVPRRNIETWILALNAVQVNEVDDYKSARSAEEWSGLISLASKALYAWTRPKIQLPEDLIDSLRFGIQEIERVF